MTPPYASAHERVDAQCPACRLHALVPLILYSVERGRWAPIPAKGLPPPRPGAPHPIVVHIDACPVCNGAWFDAGELNLLAGGDANLANIEQALDPQPRPCERACPRGCGMLVERALPGKITTPIDQCHRCGGLWLDGNERAKLAKATTREGQKSRGELLTRRGVIWVAQLITQVPVEVENPATSTPWTVLSLLAVLAVCFALQLTGTLDLGVCMPGANGLPQGRPCLAPIANALFEQWHSLGPAALVQGSWYTLLTYWLLHGGWAHLLGNCYFLYVFGDNVEHLFGRARFLAIFLAAALLGGLAEVLLSKNSGAPLVGASGGIAGVMAAYLWCFPRNKLFQLILFIQLKLPAWVYLIVWIGLQAMMAALETEDASVAWWTHLFGFMTGAALTPIFLAQRRREVSARVRVPALPYTRGAPGHGPPR
ncbi:rhomboid family intramembrane serine protease [Pseudenhygromyxa sp. WMMC2535]|uniref:rhomboid family intramembrane serine protease n=1 Tax=Pseudenhygromyxa sp. WMMC2535 TaxID=2712867 RepID=UPI0015551FD4|nr:rhomboid family intramembrane serine protease [Pseudenhygromyxa sp. WMMC2535]NVB43680.1 rhomboid family intramembrane serine protease [Pseudenhygromyxa sp. WMMC2535]